MITKTKSYHSVDGEGDAADNLDQILGGVDGDELTLQCENAARPITVRDFGVTGLNISLEGNVPMPLDQALDKLYIFYDGRASMWVEKSRFTG